MLRHLSSTAAGYARFASDLRRYASMPGAESIGLRDLTPKPEDRTEASPYDPHYFYQDVWAAGRIAERRPTRHVDVGSRVDYVGFLSVLTDVTFVDIRPLHVDLERLDSVAGSITALPFGDRTIESLSCLHVAEHIGLGRYGDELDPAGTNKAAGELQRVLAPGGHLLFSLPVGRPRLCFNAHRIHAPTAVPRLFPGLELASFAGVDDSGRFSRTLRPEDLENANYACGCFEFIRKLPAEDPASVSGHVHGVTDDVA
jgi:SAM-dependent methyltransferase